MSTFVETDERRGAQTLPAPVARFFDAVLPPGRQPITHACLKQEGTFRLGASERSWRPFTATQDFDAYPPRFVWDARIRMLPGVTVRVRDSYIDGAGSIHGTIAGIVTLLRAGGTPELAAGALQRYLAEAMWFPTRLLPGGGVGWEGIDDTCARVTLADGPTTVSLVVKFNPDGTIASVFAPARFREVKGAYVPTPWDAVCLAYGERGGFRIPVEIEVAWHVDGRRFPYWRGHVTEVAYNLAA